MNEILSYNHWYVEKQNNGGISFTVRLRLLRGRSGDFIFLDEQIVWWIIWRTRSKLGASNGGSTDVLGIPLCRHSGLDEKADGWL